MFFKKRRKDDDEASDAPQAALADDTVEGTMPAAEEVPEPALDPDLSARLADAPVPAADADAVRLFPGFEHEDFEVGFRMGGPVPALVMRWKEGGEWFRLPAMFNRAVLSSMDERDSAGDLTRLMRSFGYDVA